MIITSARLVIVALFAPIILQAQQPMRSGVSDMAPISTSSPIASHSQSSAELRIANAEKQIAKDPAKVNTYSDLAAAYLRRARETDNPDFLLEAEKALARGFKLDPANFQLQKAEVALMLARHEYPEAREKAVALNRRTPDDVMVYGYLAETDIALGDYASAEKSAQWMLNMLPNNIPALMIGAQLRVLYGDTDGALELLKLAYEETSPTEVEELAWIANKMATIQISAGEVEAAVASLEQTAQLLPGYPYTLMNLGHARLEQHRAQDAVALLRKARAVDSNPHILYELATAESVAGEEKDASQTYTDFEIAATHPTSAFDDSQQDLIVFYTSTPATATKSLELAQKRIALRHDVWTIDAYAWALYANGNFSQAEIEEQKAIAVGIQSAQIYAHAGCIATRLDHREQATKYFELSLKIDPSSEFASNARRSLGIDAVAADEHAVADSADRAMTASESATAESTPHRASSELASMQPIQTVSVIAFAPIPAKLLVPQPTDTDRRIRNAQALISRNPKDAAGYSALGAAHFQRARETGDVSDYQLAEESLNKSLDLVSTDFAADEPLSTMAEVCMGEHRFADALTYAQKALSLGSGDVSSFAIVGDAYADMGEYEKAAQAYSRLTPRDMTLSPRAAYARDSRISYLKFIAGDTPGAIALMKIAVAEGTEAHLPRENLAWLYYELGEFYAQAGDAASADIAYATALTIHPGDYRALAALGKLRSNHGNYDEAIVLLRAAIAVVPMPVFVADLGDLYARSGNRAEAQKQYQLVEYMGLLGHINQVLHNRDLAVFYADHDMKLRASLDLAQKELEVRQDVYSWDALAWALYKNGKTEQAAEASRKALRFGTKDSLLLFHAGMISERIGLRDQAKGQLTQALQINPHFHLLFAQQAQQHLTLLQSQAASGGNNGR